MEFRHASCDNLLRLTMTSPVAVRRASYSVWRSVRAIRVVRKAAPLFLLFLQEIYSGEGPFPRRNPEVSAVRQSEKQRTRNNSAHCSYLIC
jgi:hypothetical protein